MELLRVGCRVYMWGRGKVLLQDVRMRVLDGLMKQPRVSPQDFIELQRNLRLWRYMQEEIPPTYPRRWEMPP
jgi:hypothetical protein